MSVAAITLHRHVRHCHHYSGAVGRWKPGAPGRLAVAAFELFAEQGYERTTVAAIAERAGLTERTFFRYFPDKREVLFAQFGEIEAELVAAVVGAAAELDGLAAVVAGIRETATVGFGSERDAVRWRTSFIEATEELQERELRKLAAIATSLAGALRTRGLPDVDAVLLADAGLAVFRAALARWLDADDDRELTGHVDETLDRFRGLVAGH